MEMNKTIYGTERPDGVSVNFWNSFVLPTIRKIKGNKCSKCGSIKNIDFHHLKYVDVNINDLVPLCRKCHKKEHRKKND